MEEIDKYYGMVNEALAQFEFARNNDTYLIFKVWEAQTGRNFFSTSDFTILASPETISRIRRVIQNDKGELLPTYHFD